MSDEYEDRSRSTPQEPAIPSIPHTPQTPPTPQITAGVGGEEHGGSGGHEAAWLLLPWHANETLAAGERELIDRHLAGCGVCRTELARCRELGAALRTEDVTAPSPHPVQLARLLARIEASEAGEAAEEDEANEANDDGVANEERTEDRPAAGGARRAEAPGRTAAPSEALEAARAGGRRGPGALLPLLSATPRPVRWALFGQLAALLLLAVTLPLAPHLWPRTGGVPATGTGGDGAERGAGRAAYHTLSAPAAPASAHVQIHVVFAESATEKQMRDLLLRARGRLVDGPSPLGTYTLEIPVAPAAAAGPARPGAAGAATAPSAATATAAPADTPADSLGIVLTYLRSQAIVRFAEPVAGAVPPSPAAPSAPSAPLAPSEAP